VKSDTLLVLNHKGLRLLAPPQRKISGAATARRPYSLS